MAFSGSSYLAGIGTVFAAIAFGVACGSMVTTSVVQPPNRLERLKGDAANHSKRDSAPPSTASSNAEQANATKPVPREAPPSPVVAAVPSVTSPDPKPATPPRPAPAAAKVDAATSARGQPQEAATNSAPVPAAKSDDAPVTRSEGTVGRASDQNNKQASRSADPNRQASRKLRSSDDRKFSDRRRRHDQDGRQFDEATDVVRPMPRERAVGDMVEQDDGPRFGMRPRHFEFYGDDGPPRRVDGPPPGLGFFGFGD